MDFELTPEQQLLKDTLRRLLGDHYGFEQRRQLLAGDVGCSRAMWQRYAQMGLLALPFAEEHGGMQATPVETLVTMAELGRALALEPYLDTVVVCGGILRRCGTPEMQARIIPSIADGSMVLALAADEPPGAAPTRATAVGSDWRLDGRKALVVGAPGADRLVVSALAGERRSLFLVDARSEGLGLHPYRLHDGQPAATVTLNGVLVAGTDLVGWDTGPALERVHDEANAALCAEAVGVMEAAFEMTLDYLRIRHQFGVAIGTFQALRHQAADMYVALEHARSMAILAMLECGCDDDLVRRRAVSAAKVQVAGAGRSLGQAAIQLHGAMAMTDEYKVGHLFKRLETMGKRFGDADHHLERLAACAGALA
ncbi:MAG: hypothetical protein JWQ76_891 [Ramlibacter sp.]|nr:hypothetical protein [Ramlibacter sp.]